MGQHINQNSQQPPMAESKNSENVESKSLSHKDTNNAPAKKKKKRRIYYDEEEEGIQDVLWIDAEKKHPWYDAPPKVKVTMNKGLYHMNIEMIVGMSPSMVYGLFTDQGSGVFDKLMVNKVVKILKDDGPRQLMKVKKDVAWRFLWWSIPIPMTLIVDEHHINHTTTYKKDKKVFKGDYKVESIYVDAKRFCKHIVPKSPEEYKKCSGGRGRLGSKFTMNQYFQPYPPLNLPPISWYIRYITVKTCETLVEKVQSMAATIRDFT